MYIYICIYTYIHIYTHMRVYIYMHICAYVHKIHVYIYIYIYTHAGLYLHAHMCVRTKKTYLHVYKYINYTWACFVDTCTYMHLMCNTKSKRLHATFCAIHIQNTRVLMILLLPSRARQFRNLDVHTARHAQASRFCSIPTISTNVIRQKVS